jgi:hypothetical protein
MTSGQDQGNHQEALKRTRHQAGNHYQHYQHQPKSESWTWFET